MGGELGEPYFDFGSSNSALEEYASLFLECSEDNARPGPLPAAVNFISPNRNEDGLFKGIANQPLQIHKFG